MKKHVMKLRKVSTHSYAITIPKEVVKDFGWRERQKLVLEVHPRNRLVIRDSWK